MAVDALLLEEGGRLGRPVLRFYAWEEPAFTFGYSQRWSMIEAGLGQAVGERIRRLTGGGIVDHRADLTYALVVPPAHPRFRLSAPRLYEGLHRALADALAATGVPAELAPCPKACGDPSPRGPALACFTGPEADDVIHRKTGGKLAGAAMKRNRRGLLVQGSVLATDLSGTHAEEFMDAFTGNLGQWLGATPRKRRLEELGLDGARLAAWETTFADPAWNRRR
jgi:lipoate-protein ligase A